MCITDAHAATKGTKLLQKHDQYVVLLSGHEGCKGT